jgi:hypothetical protein
MENSQATSPFVGPGVQPQITPKPPNAQLPVSPTAGKSPQLLAQMSCDKFQH